MKLSSLFLLPVLAAPVLVGCSAATGDETLGDADDQSAAWGTVDVAAKLAEQLHLGKELTSPVPTMRQFGDSSQPSRITLDARGNVKSIQIAGGDVLDGIPLAIVRSYGLSGFPKLMHSAGSDLGWELDNGSIAMRDVLRECELTGAGKADPGYAQCVATAKADLASRGPDTLGSSVGVVTEVTVGKASIPLPVAYLSSRYIGRLGAFKGVSGGGSPAYSFSSGRISSVFFPSHGGTLADWVYTATVSSSGRNTNVEMCTAEPFRTTCQVIPNGH